MSSARYAVGIDLGTTHCVLSSIDLGQTESSAQQSLTQIIVPIPQLSAPGTVVDSAQLPSFIYLPHQDEFSAADLALPWQDELPAGIFGGFARQLGAGTPTRLVASAKSWLSHPGIDRRAAILPIEAAEGLEPLSPLQASIYLLRYLCAAWSQYYPDIVLNDQLVTLTVPASFDPVAKALTAEAAQAAGLDRITLLEEPQAAFYSWLMQSGEDWRNQVQVGDIVLVIDIGGGTSDLSLIAVTEEQGSLALERIAVGDHILLGGDNMDLALANIVRAKLQAQGKQLDLWQLQALTHNCRQAKETLLNDDQLEQVAVVVPARGAKLIGSTLRSELSLAEVRQTLIDGFFPVVDIDAKPRVRARGALSQLGLPYAQDAAFTRHLAAFLTRQAGAVESDENRVQTAEATFLQPTAVLFNGGVFKAAQFAERALEVVNRWLTAAGAPAARLLQGADLDLAVAKGAAYFSYVSTGRGVRIRGGTAKAYYVGIESTLPAVPGMEPPLSLICIAPFGLEEGSEAQLLEQEFGLVVGEPVRFRFFGSSVRRDDKVGTTFEYFANDDIEELEEIVVTLPTAQTPAGLVPVRLRALVTEVGTLKLEAVPRDGQTPWAVQFDTRTEG